jgi:hypothetical protein
VTKAAMKKSTCILVRPACRQQIASSAWAGRSGSFRPFRFPWFERRDFLLEPQQSGFGGDLIAPLTCRRVVAPAFQAAACPYFSGRYVTLRRRGDARDAYCIKLAAVSDVRMQCETLNHLMTTSASAPNRTSIGLYSSAISHGSMRSTAARAKASFCGNARRSLWRRSAGCRASRSGFLSDALLARCCGSRPSTREWPLAPGPMAMRALTAVCRTAFGLCCASSGSDRLQRGRGASPTYSMGQAKDGRQLADEPPP